MKKSHTRTAIELLALVVFSFILGVQYSDLIPKIRDHELYSERRIFDRARETILAHYVDPLDETTLYRAAAQGLVDHLNDAHAEILSPEEYREFQDRSTGDFAGIGVQIDVLDGWPTIVTPLPQTPAAKAGLRPGDRIVSVDGVSTEGMPLEDVVSKLKGDSGTKVKIEVKRDDDEPAVGVDLERARVHISAVASSYMVEPNVGYVEFTAFTPAAKDELTQAIDSLVEAGAKALILDLRGNPGGYLDQSFAIANLFLPSGTVIAHIRGRDQNQTYRALAEPKYEDLPMTVLVGPSTASAAEILAGALQDHERAVLIGEPTYGKGAVQQVMYLYAGHHLKLTTSRWYTPNGHSIERRHGASQLEQDDEEGGIQPGIVVLDTLGSGARVLLEAIGSKWEAARDAFNSVVIENIRAGRLDLVQAESVGSVRASVEKALHIRGVNVDPEVLDAAWPWVMRLLAHNFVAATRGEVAAQKWRDQHDPVIQRAITYFRTALKSAL